MGLCCGNGDPTRLPFRFSLVRRDRQGGERAFPVAGLVGRAGQDSAGQDRTVPTYYLSGSEFEFK